MLEKISSVLGNALKGVRPGAGKTLAQADFGDAPETIAVESSAFGHGAPIPPEYTEDGRKLSPPLTWRNAPEGTVEVVLVVEDADSPTPKPLVHALVFGLPPAGELSAGALNGAEGGLGLGKNSYLQAAYMPMDPPSGHGVHHYLFQVFALKAPSGLSGEPGRGAVAEALQGKVIAKGVLAGTYERA